MRIEITIGNQQLMLFMVFIVALFIVGIAGAYNPGGSGGNPALMGHSVDELDWSKAIPNLEVAGNVKISSGSPGVGQLLTSDATGLASWQTLKTASVCNSVDTYKTGYGWKGYGNLSQLIDDQNICEDINGCSYRIWQYNAANPAGMNNYINYPVIFRQIADGHWIDSGGDNKGINGDNISVSFVNWGGMFLYDDYTSIENSKDQLTFRDNDGATAFIITICDY